MSKSAWTLVSIVAGLAILAGAAYVALSLIATGSVGLGALPLPGRGGNPRRGYEVIPPTEVPQTQPDVVGPVVAVKDKSFTVQPDTKGTAGQNGPATEVVITADTKVFQDVTKGGPGPIQLVDGKIQQRVAPYAYSLIKVGDSLIVWGNLRGDRMAAGTVIVEVSAATPAP